MFFVFLVFLLSFINKTNTIGVVWKQLKNAQFILHQLSVKNLSNSMPIISFKSSVNELLIHSLFQGEKITFLDHQIHTI